VGGDLSWIPTWNATLNGLAGVLLVAGYLAIRRRRVAVHRALMTGAFACSVLFLISYLAYHARVGSVHFPGQGWPRTLYFAILISHTTLAATVPVLAIVTLRRALRGRFAAHRRIARWTLPIWLYVSVTGVVVYWMLYRVRWS
jgi:uncharacterized membrane protein YozB (DUF420 family)